MRIATFSFELKCCTRAISAKRSTSDALLSLLSVVKVRLVAALPGSAAHDVDVPDSQIPPPLHDGIELRSGATVLIASDEATCEVRRIAQTPLLLCLKLTVPDWVLYCSTAVCEPALSPVATPCIPIVA